MHDTVVRVRLDAKLKADTSAVLDAMGMNMSEALRIFFTRVVSDRAIPFAVQVPNAATRAALAELNAGKGARFDSYEELKKDLFDNENSVKKQPLQSRRKKSPARSRA